jgi:hypothetical protein
MSNVGTYFRLCIGYATRGQTSSPFFEIAGAFTTFENVVRNILRCFGFFIDLLLLLCYSGRTYQQVIFLS